MTICGLKGRWPRRMSVWCHSSRSTGGTAWQSFVQSLWTTKEGYWIPHVSGTLRRNMRHSASRDHRLARTATVVAASMPTNRTRRGTYAWPAAGAFEVGTCRQQGGTGPSPSTDSIRKIGLASWVSKLPPPDHPRSTYPHPGNLSDSRRNARMG